MIKLCSKVTFVGEEVEQLLKENMLILFGDNAPEELRKYCVLQESADLKKEITTGDIAIINGGRYEVTAVGSVANENLKQIGHCVLVFDGKARATLPGYIHLTPAFKGRLNPETCIIYIYSAE